MHIDAVGGGAGLAQIAHLGQHRAFDGDVEIGIFKHQQGGVAAQFHRGFQHLIGSGVQQFAAHAGGACKGHNAHPRIVQHVIDQSACALGWQHVDKALGHACFFQQWHEREHGQRCFRGRFDDHRTAGRQSGRDFARAHRSGVVPRGHQHGQTSRFMLHHDPRAGCGGMGQHPVGAHGFFGKPAEEFGGIGGLAHGIGAGFAVFQRDQMREMLKPRCHQLPRFAQHLRAVARRLGGPFFHRSFSGIQCSICIRDFRRGDRGDHFFCGGVQHVKTFVRCTFAPCAVDIKIGKVHFGLRCGQSR